MNRNLNGMSTGMALLCTLGIILFIGWMIELGTPKCIKSGCDNDAREGSSYCYLHDNSSYRYKSSGSSSYGSSTTNKSSSTSSSGKAASLLQTARKHTPPAVALQRRVTALWILMMMATTMFMKMMTTIGIVTGAMVIMLPVWTMRWKMKIGKIRYK